MNVRNGFILNNSVRSRMMIFWSSKSFCTLTNNSSSSPEQKIGFNNISYTWEVIVRTRTLIERREETRGEKKSFVRVRARPLAVYFQSERWGEHVVAVILRQVSRFVDSFVCLFNRERERKKEREGEVNVHRWNKRSLKKKREKRRTERDEKKSKWWWWRWFSVVEIKIIVWTSAHFFSFSFFFFFLSFFDDILASSTRYSCLPMPSSYIDRTDYMDIDQERHTQSPCSLPEYIE